MSSILMMKPMKQVRSKEQHIDGEAREGLGSQENQHSHCGTMGPGSQRAAWWQEAIKPAVKPVKRVRSNEQHIDGEAREVSEVQ